MLPRKGSALWRTELTAVVPSSADHEEESHSAILTGECLHSPSHQPNDAISLPGSHFSPPSFPGRGGILGMVEDCLRHDKKKVRGLLEQGKNDKDHSTVHIEPYESERTQKKQRSR